MFGVKHRSADAIEHRELVSRALARAPDASGVYSRAETSAVRADDEMTRVEAVVNFGAGGVGVDGERRCVQAENAGKGASSSGMVAWLRANRGVRSGSYRAGRLN